MGGSALPELQRQIQPAAGRREVLVRAGDARLRVFAGGGTQGVGRATTQAVVAASVLILICDFFLTKVLLWAFV